MWDPVGKIDDCDTSQQESDRLSAYRRVSKGKFSNFVKPILLPRQGKSLNAKILKNVVTHLNCISLSKECEDSYGVNSFEMTSATKSGVSKLRSTGQLLPVA